MINVTFSKNMYDEDGDNFDDCLLLHLKKNDVKMVILRLDDTEELKQFIENLQTIEQELKCLY